jgi:hypothetical protein
MISLYIFTSWFTWDAIRYSGPDHLLSRRIATLPLAAIALLFSGAWVLAVILAVQFVDLLRRFRYRSLVRRLHRAALRPQEDHLWEGLAQQVSDYHRPNWFKV